jgi:hypothetical protein
MLKMHGAADSAQDDAYHRSRACDARPAAQTPTGGCYFTPVVAALAAEAADFDHTDRFSYRSGPGKTGRAASFNGPGGKSYRSKHPLRMIVMGYCAILEATCQTPA